jgi:hypothetical protein
MKFLRMLALSFAVGVFSPVLLQAHGQQEVEPDHFDQPAAVKANVHSAKARSDHYATAPHPGSKQTRTASKHSGRKLYHHQVQA